MLGSKDIDMIDDSYIYDTYKDLYLSEKEREGRLLQGIQPANGLKAVWVKKKSDGTTLTLATQENVIKKAFDKRFSIPLDFDFFKHPVYPCDLKENLIVSLELNSPWKVILCNGDTSATYKLSDISLECDAIFDEPYSTTIVEMYKGTTSIPYTKVGLIHYQTLSKKDTIWKIDMNNFLFVHCRVCCYYFLINVMILQIRMKNFVIQTLRKF